MTGTLEERLLAHAPLFRAWADFLDQGPQPFTIPGHQRRAGTVSQLLGRLLDADVPLFGGLDGVDLERGVLAEAQQAAARQWGVDWCRYSTGGATHANQAALLAAAPPGSSVLVGRNAHRSTLLGLVLSGARPVWLPVDIEPCFGLPIGVGLSTIEAALVANPDAAAIALVSPTYPGLVKNDLRAVINAAHLAGVPVIIDQAWGACHGFHSHFPPHAPSLAADLVVTSAHKGLPAFTQGAILLANTERVDQAALDRGFEASNTTSPAGAILASIDAARAILAEPEGSRWLMSAAAAVAAVRERLEAGGLRAPGPADFPSASFDPLKLVIQRRHPGHDLRLVARRLVASGLPVEMSDRDTLVAVVGFIDPAPALDHLVGIILEELKHSESFAGGEPSDSIDTRGSATIPAQALTPREAFFAAQEKVPAARALGRVCAEIVAPYPPGVPVLIPGEIIDASSLETLTLAADRGIRIAYAADPTLHTLRVVS